MARISSMQFDREFFSDEDKKEFATCIFCGKESLNQGGFWQGYAGGVGVCLDCINCVVDLAIDCLEDSKQFRDSEVEEKSQQIMEIVNKRISKKEKIKENILMRKFEEELKLSYYVEGAPIDFFRLAMNKDELVHRLCQPEYYGDSQERYDLVLEEVSELENKISNYVLNISREKPYIIRYFAIPEMGYNIFRIGVIAKIDNNGTTYIFAHRPEVLEAFGADYREKAIKIKEEHFK